MSDDRPGPIQLPPKIRDLVATDRLGRPAVGRLSQAQVEALIAVATRPWGYDEPVSARRALHALAVGADADVAIPVLDAVLANSEAAQSDRVVAARELGLIATPDAEAVLTRRVRQRDPRVQQAVLAGLGMFAGPPVLRELGKLSEPRDAATRRQLALTRALIAHRHGLDGPFLPEAPAAPRRRRRRADSTPVTMRLKTAKATTEDRRHLLGSTYGIDFADRSYGVTCGRSEWTMFVNRDVGRSVTAADQIFTRPLIAALLGRWFPDRFATTPQYLLLTRPTDGSARLDVVRTDGEVMYTGTAEPADGGVVFRVGDVERPGRAPTTLAGRLTPRGVDLDTATSASRVDTPSTSSVVVP